MSAALGPKLTAYDKDVLRAVSSEGADSTWTIAQRVLPHDLEGFLATLNGLERLGYVVAEHRRHLRHWRRTSKGDEAVR